ncbi:MAG: TonB family protein [Pseudomonadota bacterium]
MMHTTTPHTAPCHCAGLAALSLATVAVGGCVTPTAPAAPESLGIAVPQPAPQPEAEEFGVIRTCNAAYPSAAGGMMGYVEMTFQVGIDGKPFNLAIANAEPANVFDDVALEALACWRFQPEYDTSRVRRVIIEFVP